MSGPGNEDASDMLARARGLVASIHSEGNQFASPTAAWRWWQDAAEALADLVAGLDQQLGQGGRLPVQWRPALVSFAAASAYCPDCGTWQEYPQHRSDCPYRQDEEGEGFRTDVGHPVWDSQGRAVLDAASDAEELDRFVAGHYLRDEEGEPVGIVGVTREGMGWKVGLDNGESFHAPPGTRLTLLPYEQWPGHAVGTADDGGCPGDPDGQHHAGCGCPDVDPVNPN